MATLRIPYGDDGLPLRIITPVGYAKTSDNPAGFTHNISEADMVQVDAVSVGSDAAGQYIDLGIVKNTQFSKVLYEGTINTTGSNQIILAIGSALPTVGIVIQSIETIHTYFPVLGDKKVDASSLIFGKNCEICIDYVAETISVNGSALPLVAGNGTLGHGGTNVQFSGRNQGATYTLDAGTKKL